MLGPDFLSELRGEKVISADVPTFRLNFNREDENDDEDKGEDENEDEDEGGDEDDDEDEG